MAKSLLAKHLDGVPPAPQTAPHVPRVDFQLANGNHMGFGYSQAIWMTFNPSKGIQVKFSTHTVTIEGTSLKSLYMGLIRQEVVEVREASAKYGRPEKRTDEPIVTKLNINQNPGTEGEGGPFFKPLSE